MKPRRKVGHVPDGMAKGDTHYVRELEKEIKARTQDGTILGGESPTSILRDPRFDGPRRDSDGLLDIGEVRCLNVRAAGDDAGGRNAMNNTDDAAPSAPAETTTAQAHKTPKIHKTPKTAKKVKSPAKKMSKPSVKKTKMAAKKTAPKGRKSVPNGKRANQATCFNLPKKVKDALKKKARAAGVSRNELVNQILAKAAGVKLAG